MTNERVDYTSDIEVRDTLLKLRMFALETEVVHLMNWIIENLKNRETLVVQNVLERATETIGVTKDTLSTILSQLLSTDMIVVDNEQMLIMRGPMFPANEETDDPDIIPIDRGRV